jgi:hypothetical protein
MLALMLFAGLAFAQENSENNDVYRVSRVDHNKHQLFINDRLYIMPINLNVYVFKSTTRKTTKANRYALRKDQVVFFKKEIRDRQAYIYEITIFRP